MKKITKCLLILLVLVAPALGVQAAMDSYCSAPPYVTRTIPPNIMVLIDNSQDMLNPAHTAPGDPINPAVPGYDRDTTYLGYFIPEGCYSYGSNIFEEQLNTLADPDRSYTMEEDCPAGAPFRGNLMNWATMSKYDVLEKVLIGGNTASKQGNAHTLISISSDWAQDKYHNGCIFQVDNGNLTITEQNFDDCSLLDDPATPIESLASFQGELADPLPTAAAPRQLQTPLGALFSRFGAQASDALALVDRAWENFSLVSEAQAALPCPDIVPGALNATAGEDFTFTLTLPSNFNNKIATWTLTTIPAWLTTGPIYSQYNGRLDNGVVTFSGSTTTPGSYPFEASVTSTSCDGSSAISGNILVEGTDLVIYHYDPDLPDGAIGVAYSQEIFGDGGIGALSWSVNGLPAGLSFVDNGNSVTISGVPNAEGTFSVTLTLSDSAGGSLAKNVDLTISAGLTISTNTLPDGQVGETYDEILVGIGGAGAAFYTWSIIAGSLPAGVSLSADGVFSGALAAGSEGPYTITVQLDDGAATVSKVFSFDIVAALGHVEIFSTSPLPDAYKNVWYSYQLVATGGCEPYAWAVTSGSLPTWMSLSAEGLLSGTPDNNQDINYDPFEISVTGCGGHVDSKSFTIAAFKNSPAARSKSFSVKVKLIEEDLTDLNGNGIWDEGEAFTDLDGDNVWDGKGGVFQTFWDTANPRARWGMTKFKDQGQSTIVEVDSCIPVGNPASFYTAIQNATPANSSPLADGLYGAVNYYGFEAPYGEGYSGCNNSDPIDDVPCRKNFILVLTSGADLTGASFASLPAACDADAADLTQNACFGYQTDLRSAQEGKQNVSTYIVHTLGEENEATEDALEEAALEGGGMFYPAGGENLEDQLKKALADILDQAASGTAVSVLTTSSRGIGSMMQAYFLPVRPEGSREVGWTGYVQNLWIDKDDNLREDTVQDLTLDTDDDRVLKLFFNTDTNETKAALFTNQDLAACSITDEDIIDFDQVSYNWEGGEKLALMPPSERELFTSTKVLRGAATAHSFNADAGVDYPKFTATMEAGLLAALDPDATYSAANIVAYVRGECLEGNVSGDTDCSGTVDSTYRDRRVTVTGGGANGNVWKLGDVISSTPKVLAGTPSNTYHIDYGDLTYHSFVSNDDYAKRSAVAFVGANDGVLHAFRVGYLKDSETPGILGWFQNIFGPDTDDDEIGEELWGYIPYNAFPYLKYLADPDYCHIFYNDLSVRLVDASIGGDPDDTRLTGSWRTILLGGMRFGGACDGGSPSPPLAANGYSAYYAIDVTDAENPIPLWEFSDPDLGYTTGFPSVVRTGDRLLNGNWYVAFGSGSTTLPKSSTDMNRSTPGYVYILNLKTGERVKKVPLDHNAIVGDILAIDKDKDYTSEKLYFGTSYLDGGVWKGKLVTLPIPLQDLTSAWDAEGSLTYLFEEDFPFTASPDAAKDSYGKTWVYIGSGKYNSDVDEDTSDSQIFLGLKDTGGIIYPVALGDSDLVDKTNVETTGTVTETEQVCAYDPNAVGSFAYKTVVTATTPTSPEPATPAKGWYVSLSGGERVISRPLAVGGLVDFLTYKPSTDLCSYGGDSYLYAVGYTSGEAPASVAIRDPSTTGGATSGEVTIDKGILLGPGAPPTGEAIIIAPPKEGEEQLKKKIQVATGVIVEAENTPVISIASKIVHWLKK